MRASDAKLAAALREAGIAGLANEAAHGDFNEFFGLYDFPVLTLAALLAKIGTTSAMALRVCVVAGEFDATVEESDEWRRSDEGKAAWVMLSKVDP